MNDTKLELWKVHVVIEPPIEWQKMGIDTFRITRDETITIERELENSTELLFTVVSNAREVHNRAEILAKAFLSCLELEAQRGYRFSVGRQEPVSLQPTANGWIPLSQYHFTVQVARKFDDLDLGLFKRLSSSLIMLPADKRNKILEALEFLYDGLAAHTAQQCFLSIYGGINYLIAGEVKAGKTTRREDLMIVSFAEKGVLQVDEVKSWVERFNELDAIHYDVLQGGKCTPNQLRNIKQLFRKFLMKYIEYVEANDKNNDLPSS